MELSGFNAKKSERLNIRRVTPFSDKIVLYIMIMLILTIHNFLLLTQNLTLIDSNTILTSYMTLRIMSVISPPITRYFPAWLSQLIASFMGASVIGHGTMVGNIAC
jgi:hypothetical protein